MSSSTIFIALQCCQCSTMQVKQKKKSSNKWSCAVCNQKQSVQKVFAQGFMAKDLRKFVQNFNMSRKFVDDGECLDSETLDPVSEHGDCQHELPATKKRTDWTGYLDREEDHHCIIKGAEQQEGDDFEPLVVTELEKGMFKKRKLVEDSSRVGCGGSDNYKLFRKPVLPKPQEEPIQDQRRTPLTERNSERNNYLTSSNHNTTKCKATSSSRAASKWNAYVTEDNDNLELGWKKKAFNYNDKDDSAMPWNNILEGITSEQRVEDDIHPDFM